MVFNWPKLAGGLAVVVAAGLIGGLARILAVVVGYFLVASLVVSWWVYDHSPLHDWRWLRPLLPALFERWALVHAGFDEAGSSLPAAIGHPAAVVDVSAGLGRVSPSLRRARRHLGSGPAAETVMAGEGLPLASGSCDAVLLVFAAHEVRDHDRREALFDELRRVVRPAGRIVLVEHHRGWANIAAFGPAAWHFQTRREWLRLAERGGYQVQEAKVTPFVRGLALCPC